MKVHGERGWKGWLDFGLAFLLTFVGILIFLGNLMLWARHNP